MSRNSIGTTKQLRRCVCGTQPKLHYSSHVEEYWVQCPNCRRRTFDIKFINDAIRSWNTLFEPLLTTRQDYFGKENPPDRDQLFYTFCGFSTKDEAMKNPDWNLPKGYGVEFASIDQERDGTWTHSIYLRKLPSVEKMIQSLNDIHSFFVSCGISVKDANFLNRPQYQNIRELKRYLNNLK